MSISTNLYLPEYVKALARTTNWPKTRITLCLFTLIIFKTIVSGMWCDISCSDLKRISNFVILSQIFTLFGWCTFIEHP